MTYKKIMPLENFAKMFYDEVSIDLPHGLPHESGLSLLLGGRIPRRNPGAPKPPRG
jgi:hypothetical protein